jgi:hypothetical protein
MGEAEQVGARVVPHRVQVEVGAVDDVQVDVGEQGRLLAEGGLRGLRPLLHGLHQALRAVRAVHAGHLGDYVAWLVAGVALFGLMLGMPGAGR